MGQSVPRAKPVSLPVNGLDYTTLGEFIGSLSRRDDFDAEDDAWSMNLSFINEIRNCLDMFSALIALRPCLG